MKLNLVYIGPEHLLHIRRDLLLFFRYNLEEAGCDVSITFNHILADRLNVLFGSTELNPADMQGLRQNKAIKYVVFDAEVVTGDTINHRQEFEMNSYLEFLSGAVIVLTGFEFNRDYWRSKGLQSTVMRIGYTEKLREIEHKPEKDIDVFFFGLVSEYRKEILENLTRHGLNVEVQGYGASPYFLRNSYIERSKLVANISQDPKYDHVNGLRVLYLAINGCCTVAERLSGTTNQYDLLQHNSKSPEHFAQDCLELIREKKFSEMGNHFRETAQESFSCRESTAEVLNLIRDNLP